MFEFFFFFAKPNQSLISPISVPDQDDEPATASSINGRGEVDAHPSPRHIAQVDVLRPGPHLGQTRKAACSRGAGEEC